MKYGKLYNLIENETRDEHGTTIIDKWIIEDEIDQTTIIEMIDYIAYFIDTTSFKNMNYWKDYRFEKDIQNLHKKQKVERDIINILLKRQERRTTELKYYIKKLDEVQIMQPEPVQSP